MKTTVFSLETRNHTYYIDFDSQSQNYYIYCDEKYVGTRQTIGEAFEKIYTKLPINQHSFISKR